MAQEKEASSNSMLTFPQVQIYEEDFKRSD